MPVKVFLSVLLFFCARQAFADLYRWVDPETGSVKFSSYPPPWHGDPLRERRAPKVEVIPPMRTPVPAPAFAPAALPGPESGGVLEKLNQVRRSIMQSMSVQPPPRREDFARAGDGIKQQVDAYNAVSAELDKIDPGGAAARRAEGQPVLERLMQGLKAQLTPGSPVKAP